MREQRRDTRLSGGQVDVGDLQVALEIWSLKGRATAMVQMGKHEQGDGRVSQGHGHHYLGPTQQGVGRTWK